MPTPLSEAERVARVLRDKKIRRSMLDREIAALEDMARVYERTAQHETRKAPQQPGSGGG